MSPAAAYTIASEIQPILRLLAEKQLASIGDKRTIKRFFWEAVVLRLSTARPNSPVEMSPLLYTPLVPLIAEAKRMYEQMTATKLSRSNDQPAIVPVRITPLEQAQVKKEEAPTEVEASPANPKSVELLEGAVD